MSTTTIRLPDDLKARVASAAERAGTSTHSFILNAIAETTADAERRTDFHDTADARYAAVATSGKTVPWREMRGYLEDRLAGKRRKHPTAKKL